jgi:hypothetical protein
MAQAPDAWDYAATDIPSPLTDELEAAQQSKKVRPLACLRVVTSSLRLLQRMAGTFSPAVEAATRATSSLSNNLTPPPSNTCKHRTQADKRARQRAKEKAGKGPAGEAAAGGGGSKGSAAAAAAAAGGGGDSFDAELAAAMAEAAAISSRWV